MEIIRNNKGGAKLCLNGYMYVKKATKKSRIRWQCSMRDSKSCNGAVTTNLEMSDPHETAPHNHEACTVSAAVAKTKESMKSQVQNARARPGQVLAAAVHGATQEVRVDMGRDETLRRTLRRQKRAAMPADPASTADLELTGVWTTTGASDRQPFLVYDSGPQEADRLLVFSSQEQLRHLALADKWFLDGTFSVAPRLFRQLYVIRAQLGESAVTCVYAFMTGKTQLQYESLLRIVCEKTERIGIIADPSTVVCDFEQAVINAVMDVLGSHVRIQGCFFHLCQSTWRKIQELGLARAYKEKDDVHLFCGMLDSLAFLPVEEVPEGMKYLRENMPSEDGLQELVDYFDATYVSGTTRQILRQGSSALTVRLRRYPPMFPPDKWNVHASTLAGDSRTNNICEGWNNAFSQLVGHSHPSIWTAIDAIQMDQAMVSKAIQLNARGEPPSKRVRRETVQLQKSLQVLCRRRIAGELTIPNFLRAVGHTVHFSKTRRESAEPEDVSTDTAPAAASQPPPTRRRRRSSGPSNTVPAAVNHSCPVCLCMEADTVIIPCGHCMCATCISRLSVNESNTRCPVCRTEIRDKIRMHFAL